MCQQGRAHKRYEFGSKDSMATTSRGGWFVGAMVIHGNPYDGHTLSKTLAQVERIAQKPQRVFVDRGYRGHNYKGDIEVHADKVRRGRMPKSLWRWMKRRAAIEPSIGHLKQEHRMERNRLNGKEGGRINAILSAAGMNIASCFGGWLIIFCVCLDFGRPPMIFGSCRPKSEYRFFRIDETAYAFDPCEALPLFGHTAVKPTNLKKKS